jgi:hypothetical protein
MAKFLLKKATILGLGDVSIQPNVVTEVPDEVLARYMHEGKLSPTLQGLLDSGELEVVPDAPAPVEPPPGA